jgi:Transposase, Mutator family
VAQAAAATLDNFAVAWGDRYPAIVRLWQAHWAEFTSFLAFPPEVRRVIYTTNLIESMNSRLRKVTRNRGQFSSEQAALKVLYLTVPNLEGYRTRNTGIRSSGWKQALLAMVPRHCQGLTLSRMAWPGITPAGWTTAFDRSIHDCPYSDLRPIRPLAALLATLRTNLMPGERAFAGWIAPPGIVAVATASTFAACLAAKGIGGASKILPATFLLIVATVTLYGVTATPVARRLGVTRPARTRPLLVGGDPWVVDLGRAMQGAGLQVLMLR